MPDEQTLKRARRDKAQGKSASTQAGEFVREEMDHIREGKYGARSPQQAIAIGLSKARRAGVRLPVPAPEKASEGVRRKARNDLRQGQAADVDISSVRSQAIKKALKREERPAASPHELAQQAHRAAARRRAAERNQMDRKAPATKGKTDRPPQRAKTGLAGGPEKSAGKATRPRAA